jgi:prepilin-type processing-associated H-X9-DG protein
MKKQTKASYRNRNRAATKDLTPRQLVSGKSAHPGGANFVMGDGSVRMGDGSVRLLKTAVSN